MATRAEDVLGMTWDTRRSLAPQRAVRNGVRGARWAGSARRAPWAGLALVALWVALAAGFLGGVAAPAGRLQELVAAARAAPTAAAATAPVSRR